MTAAERNHEGHERENHQRALRAALRPLRRKSTARALAIVTADAVLYAVCVCGALRTAGDWRGWCFGVAESIAIVMLFIVGHDACHGSFTPSRALNGILGRLAFLPSLTPYRTWETGHNHTHHIYTNLKPHDYVWTPFTKAEYDALPRWRRALEHVYRSAPGVGLYYACEIWWRYLWRPLTAALPARLRPVRGLRDRVIRGGLALRLAGLAGRRGAAIRNMELVRWGGRSTSITPIPMSLVQR